MLPFDDPLGAFCAETHAALPGSGTGPLAGLTFAVKDVFHIKGHRTGFGSPEWLSTHDPADVTASAVQRVLEGSQAPDEAIRGLMTRSLKDEHA